MKSKIYFPFANKEEIDLSEFELLSDQLADVLSTNYKNQPIAFLADKSLEHCLVLYAAFKVGNPFYHLNLQLPQKKQIEIIQKLGIKNIFIDKSFQNIFTSMKSELTDLNELKLEGISANAQKESVDEKQPAYFISTSGSTGDPKLIKISHGQLNRALKNIHELVQLETHDIFTHVSQFCFDVSIADFLLPLRAGCSLIMIPGKHTLESLNCAHKQKATVWSSAPSLFKFCSQFSPDITLPDLKKVIHCGENFDLALTKLWQIHAPQAELINLYGPAEATIAISGHKTFSKDSALPIGTIFKDHDFIFSQEGELVIKGPQVIDHYLNGAKTLDENDYYHTGDLFCSLNNEYFFNGRNDDQIKIGGMRFTLSEIENEISKSFSLKNFAVILAKESIYLILHSSEDVELPILQKKLCESLPEKFVPKKIVKLDEFPLNSSGKLDRKKLAALFSAE